MSQTLADKPVQVVEAIYENGVFRPLSPPVELEEHTRVNLTVAAPPPRVSATAPSPQGPPTPEPDDVLIEGLDPDVVDEIALAHEFSLHES